MLTGTSDRKAVHHTCGALRSTEGAAAQATRKAVALSDRVRVGLFGLCGLTGKCEKWARNK